MDIKTINFIESAKKIHGDKYDYSETIVINTKNKVKIICPKHGAFFQNTPNHLMGKKCAKCSNVYKSTESDIIEKLERHYKGIIKKYELDTKNRTATVWDINDISYKVKWKDIYNEVLTLNTNNVNNQTELFIHKALNIHGDKYSYNKTIYKHNAKKVIITCNTCEKNFTQTPNSHLNGNGCSNCVGRNKKIPDIIKEFNKLHKDKYDYSNIKVYKDTKANLLIKCNKCETKFEQSYSNHVRGHGCPKCVGRNKTKEELMEIYKEKHGDKYDYSLINWSKNLKNSDVVDIICKNHGVFTQTIDAHKKHGCSFCVGIKINDEILFKKFKEKHGNRYDYTKVKYIKHNKKITIICNIHGEFNQTPNSHIRGQGCPKCGFDNTKKHKQENPVGWTTTNWEKAAKKSKCFESFKVYIIKCSNEVESFYKIGRTFTSVKNRFKQKKNMPYLYSVIYEFSHENPLVIYKLESHLKKLNSEFKYKPNIKFGGVHECYSNLAMSYEDLDKHVKKISINL